MIEPGSGEVGMRSGLVHAWAGLALLLTGSGCASSTITKPSDSAKPDAAPPATTKNVVPDNAELEYLYTQDQMDRQSEPVDWKAVSARDDARQQRVRELLDLGGVLTGRDYYHAAMVFQHSAGIEGIELAHELAMIAMWLGEPRARWLAAASYDRLLGRLGRGQRFGTQFISAGGGDPMHPAPIDPGVTDAMRAAMNCPTIGQVPAQASSRAAGASSAASRASGG